MKTNSRIVIITRNLFLDFLPPIISKLYFRFRNRNANPPIDKSTLSLMSGLIPSELEAQVDSFINSQDYLKTSRYWRHLILRHLRVMSSKGVENWGNSVAFNYFTWTRLDDTKLQSLTHHNLEDSNFLKIHKGLTPAESYSYNVITNLLWEHLRKSSHISLKQLESFSNRFSAGNAPTVVIGGMPVTQDLLNSAIEYESFSTALPSIGGSILEIGAGSGRNADFMLSLGTVTKYMIIDIPPASFIAMERLTKNHPSLRIYACKNSQELEDYLKSEEWDVLFILPSFASVLPTKYFDLTLAIDCLHEMTKIMRLTYSGIAKDKSRNFYVKVWKKAFIPVDREFLDATNFDQYGFDPNWNCLRSATCVFPSDFHEHLFKFNET